VAKWALGFEKEPRTEEISQLFPKQLIIDYQLLAHEIVLSYISGLEIQVTRESTPRRDPTNKQKSGVDGSNNKNSISKCCRF
jgi:hypothetical protein